MKTISIYLFLFIPFLLLGQNPDDVISTQDFKNTLLLHKEFVSIPNLPENKELMLQNIQWVAQKYDNLDFETTLLETSTLPILIAEKEYNPNYKTVLFYFHIDGQPINPDAWDQDHPFTPVLKEKDKEGNNKEY